VEAVKLVSTASAEETFALGEQLGAVLLARDFVGLSGQLGAGKTQFSRGVAQGAGVPLDDVSSPTYSIVQTYRGRLELHHVDLYRLVTDDDLFAIGWFDLLEGDGAFLVEWVDQVRSASPADALLVTITVLGPEQRRFELRPTGQASQALLHRWLP
jgi:tRNA threonylcarbamoyladenosine biosynthesis protein TsaE